MDSVHTTLSLLSEIQNHKRKRRRVSALLWGNQAVKRRKKISPLICAKRKRRYVCKKGEKTSLFWGQIRLDESAKNTLRKKGTQGQSPFSEVQFYYKTLRFPGCLLAAVVIGCRFAVFLSRKLTPPPPYCLSSFPRSFNSFYVRSEMTGNAPRGEKGRKGNRNCQKERKERGERGRISLIFLPWWQWPTHVISRRIFRITVCRIRYFSLSQL